MYSLNIQSTFEEVIQDVESGNSAEDQFWINVFDSEIEADDQIVKEEVIKVLKVEGELEFQNEALKLERTDKNTYKAYYKEEDHIIKTQRRLIETGAKEASSFDISPQGTLYAIGDSNGNLTIGNVVDGSIERTIEEAHFSDIVKTLFFPSGQVLLSVSLDMSIKLWNIATGDNPRTFASHKKRITDVAMIEKGRNFVSSSLDGTIKLWDCGSGSNFHTFRRKESLSDGVTSVHVIEFISESSDSSLHNTTYPEEFGTGNKILLAGHISGVISGFDLFSKRELFSISAVGGAVKSISTSLDQPDHIIAAYSNGVIAKWDLKSKTKPLETYTVPGKYIDQVALNEEFGLFTNGFGVHQLEDGTKATTLVANDDIAVDLTVTKDRLYVLTNIGDIIVYNN